jgi:hypothetical protein
VKRDEAHHKVARENRHHQSARDATDGYNWRWCVVKGGEVIMCGQCPFRAMSTWYLFFVRTQSIVPFRDNNLNLSGREVKKDEDHYQLAGENRHHRTTYATDGYASRITEDKKGGEVFMRVDIALLGQCPHSICCGA